MSITTELSQDEFKVHGQTILVIDDDEAARDLLSRFLSRLGYQVETAESCEIGLTNASVLRPHVIFLDVLMNGFDGCHVLTALKADHALAGIPVIILSIVEEQKLGYA